MGIWQWLFRKPRFERFDDSFALTRESLFDSLHTAIVNQQRAGRSIWIVAHFPETYLQIGERLSGFGFEYQIVGESVTPTEVLEKSKRASASSVEAASTLTLVPRPLASSATASTQPSDLRPPPIQLVLAELLDDSPLVAGSPASEFDQSESVSMIVLERHPLMSIDQRIERFAAALPCPVRFGYYLSIEDTVVQRAASEELLHLLRLWGMEEQQLISSTMLTRRLEKRLKKDTVVFLTNPRTDSAAEWYEEVRSEK